MSWLFVHKLIKSPSKAARHFFKRAPPLKQTPHLKRTSCPLCHRPGLSSWFTLHTPHIAPDVTRCQGCGLALLDPQPDDDTLNSIYDETYFIGSDGERMRAEGNALKRATAKLHLAEIARAIKMPDANGPPPRMLEVGCGLGNFLLEAQKSGFDVHGVDVSASAVQTANEALGEDRVRTGHLQDMDFSGHPFDLVVLADVLEHVRDPWNFMRHVHSLLKPGGLIFVAVPSLDSLSARLMGRFWVEFKPEHLFYFNRPTLTRTLDACGYQDITIRPGYKVLSLGYIIAHFEQFPMPVLTPVMRIAGRVLPRRILSAHLRIVASGINATARAKPAPKA